MAKKTKRKAAGKRRPVSVARWTVPEVSLQIDFWARLQQIRSKYLANALSRTVDVLKVAKIDRELEEYVGDERLAPLTREGLRGEVFYPVPILLETAPQLLGYYRLLYGWSQKEFYKTPLSRLSGMEERNELRDTLKPLLPELCRNLITAGFALLGAVQPISIQAVHELQLLTVGPQFRGSQNVAIGQGATQQVFALIRKLVDRHVQNATETVISVRNAAGRSVHIAFAADPDITIIEMMPLTGVPSTSIEIKGGADVSNVHNRIGEAEKSHLNAKASGFTRFWTILKARIDAGKAKSESPTTTAFFNLDGILDERSREHAHFRELLYQTIGIG